MNKLKGAKLSNPLYLTLIISSSALWLTGAAWLLFHYFGRTEGEFGIAAHPLEYAMLQLHGFAVIPALASIGGIIFSHIGSGWNYKHNKFSGLTMLAVFGVLVGTGYALYYAGGDILRQASSLAHWITGLAAPIIFLIHAWHSVKDYVSARKFDSKSNSERNTLLAS